MITRYRQGLATNSSSSHSMVTLPAGVTLPEIGVDLTYPVFDNGYRLTTELSKRHYLAAVLRDQADVLWGRSALRPAGADPYDQPDGVNDRPFDLTWDTRPPDQATLQPYGLDMSRSRAHLIHLPRWLTRRINELTGLPPDTDLSGHSAENSFGQPFEVPRDPAGVGPHPTAWEAILAVILDPSTVVYAPEENDEDDADEYPPLALERLMKPYLTPDAPQAADNPRAQAFADMLNAPASPATWQERTRQLNAWAQRNRVTLVGWRRGGTWTVQFDPDMPAEFLPDQPLSGRQAAWAALQHRCLLFAEPDPT